VKPLHSGIVLILAGYFVMAIAFSVINPLHEGTDELRHYRFVRTIAATGQLPVQGEEPCRSQSHHPPLFYAAGALVTAWIKSGRDLCQSAPENPFWAYRYWDVGADNKNMYLHGEDEAFPWYGEALAAHLVRLVNILIGAGVVWLTWATGRAIWPRWNGVALGAAAIVAFNPMFLYMAAAINNDVIAALAGTAVTYACIRLLREPHRLNWRWGVLLGSLYGLALLSKFNLAPIIALIVAAVSWAAWQKVFRPGESERVEAAEGATGRHGLVAFLKLWLPVNLLILSTAALLAGWWFVRNQILYGEPTGFQEVTQLWGARAPFESFGLAVSELPYAWTTLWGRFGFGQIPLPQIIYDSLLVIVVIGLAGALYGALRRASQAERPSLLFLGANVLLFFSVLFNYMLVSPAGPNGRFFFPAISAMALLVAYGWGQLILDTGNWVAQARNKEGKDQIRLGDRRRAGSIVATAAGIGMFLLGLIVLLGFLAPAYARPPTLSPEATIPNPVNAEFDTLVTLLGYETSADTLRPGEALDLDLYWQVNARPPGNYLLFVHLLDESGAIIAQRDTHPGLGNFPSGQWRPGDRFVDSVRLYLPETAYVPSSATLSIGLYAPDAYRLEVRDAEGQLLGDAFPIDRLKMLPAGDDFPNPQNYIFNEEIGFVGYQYETREILPGESLAVTLYWQAIKDVTRDYVVRLRLLDEAENPWMLSDNRPGDGASHTDAWKAGEIYEDTHRLDIDPNVPPGTYRVEIALFDVESGRRQSIVAEDGHLIDSRLLLAPLRITSKAASSR
jgi:4-amino-4-deoxy-L-arabinose transferase-like glycosyltransferase